MPRGAEGGDTDPEQPAFGQLGTGIRLRHPIIRHPDDKGNPSLRLR